MKKITSIVLTIILLATFALFAMGSSDSNTDKVEPAKTSEQAPVSQEEAKEEKNENSSANSRTEIRAGETLNMNEFKITYDGSEVWTSTNEFIQPAEGKQFIRLHFSVANDSSSDQYISSLEFECYADNEKCETSYIGDDQISATLSSGRKTSGYVYFEIPVGASEIEVEYETNFWTNKKAFFIVELG